MTQIASVQCHVIKIVIYRVLETHYCTELINVDSQYSDATKLHDFLYAGCSAYFNV